MKLPVIISAGSVVAMGIFMLGVPEGIRQQVQPQRAGTGAIATTNISPNLKAFLATIRYAEGTAASDGYRTIYTGAKFNSFDSHPTLRKCANAGGRQLCSDAAGAYQFLSSTWNATAKRIGAKDFSPKNQDLGAIDLVKNAGALPDIEAGNFEAAVHKVSPIWASLPNKSGASFYAHTGQSARPIDKLRKIYLQAGGQIK